LWLGTTGQLAKLHESRPELALQNCTIQASDETRSLGVIVQSDLSFKRHVQAVSRSSFFQLRQLRNVRHSVDSETAATLIHAFVSSRLDYCNSLLSRAPKNVQNAAARLLLGYSRRQSGLQKAMREKCALQNCAFRHQVTYIERV